ncbi:MAG: tripartite tricarboxylate transporter TctB family protein [Burkholderiaceae bacterium]
MRQADRVTGAALLALSVAFAVGALQNYTYWGENGPGSGFLPFWLGVTMAVLATVMLVRALRSTDPGPAWLPDPIGLRRLALVLGATLGLAALLNLLGMVLATVLFMIVIVRGLDRHPWPRTLAVAAGVAAFNFLVFTWWLRVPLPVGVFGF